MRNVSIAKTVLGAALILVAGMVPATAAEGAEANTYSAEEVAQEASEFFAVGGLFRIS